jgi:fructose-1-phosphate kinase PfkB-like protein
MIITVTLNAAIDKTLGAEFQIGRRHRSSDSAPWRAARA